AEEDRPGRRVKPIRPEERSYLACLEPSGERIGTARAEERRPAAAAEVAVPKHRDAQSADPLAEETGRVLRLGIAGPEPHEPHDVGRPDAGMDALVPAEVDPLGGDSDRGGEGLHQAGGMADAGVHRPVVI